MIDTVSVVIFIDLLAFQMLANTLSQFSRRPQSGSLTADGSWDWGCFSSTRQAEGWSYVYYRTSFRSGCCELKLKLSESLQRCGVKLSISSLPAFVSGHNASLISPNACRAALAAIDAQLQRLGLPLIWSWGVSRVDFSFDFLVDLGYAPSYLWSFFQRLPRLSGRSPSRYRFGPDESSVLWWWDEHYCSLILYSKFDALPVSLRTDAHRGKLRFEVRLRRDGCNAWAARKSLPGGHLLVSDLIYPGLPTASSSIIWMRSVPTSRSGSWARFSMPFKRSLSDPIAFASS